MSGYEIRYLPLFQQDLIHTANYISDILGNPDAANVLIDEVESKIIERSYNPLSFQKYPSKRKRNNPYYAIYVRNYIVFYVVIGNIVEVRRFLYHKRNLNQIL